TILSENASGPPPHEIAAALKDLGLRRDVIPPESAQVRSVLDRFHALLPSARLVTFDCWDTLLNRLMPPDYVKLVGARALIRERHLEASEWELLRLRCEVEGELALRPTCDSCRSGGRIHEYRHEEVVFAWLDRLGVVSRKAHQARLLEQVVNAEL